MRTETARPIRLQDYRPPDWLVKTVELDVSLDAAATRVRATLSLAPNPEGSPDVPLRLDGEDLRLVGIKLDNEALAADRYEISPDGLTIARVPNRPFRLEIETVLDPSANTQLLGLYRSGGTYCTQCEAEGFRRITYFPDRPDVMAVYTTRVEADRSEAPVLLANGNLVSSGAIAGTNRHFAVWHDPFPKPSYLFALVGGVLASVEDRFRTMSGRDVALKIYVEPGKEPRAAWAMDSLKRSMRWDEEAFGREYDLDIFMIVAVSTFNMGAMENKGLNIFNDKYVLASSDTATDTDYASIEGIIAHEYFHNWTGNRITCRDWFQLCLKEGLTVFRDQEFAFHERSEAVERITDVRVLRSHQFTEDAGPLAHPVRPEVYNEINNFYTPTVYEKGAEIIRILKVLIGAENFRRGMDLYFSRHDGRVATVEEFVQCFADVTGSDFSRFMRWYTQAGTPEVTVTPTYDPNAQTCRLDIAQTVAQTPGQPLKQPLIIPLVLGLIGTDGTDLPLVLDDRRELPRSLIVLTDHAESFTFTGIEAQPVLSINRGFSAPIKLNVPLSPEELRFRAAHDRDPFNRWQSIQTLVTRHLVNNAASLRAGNKATEDTSLLGALKTILLSSSFEPAYVAHAITLPSEADVARDIGKDVDPSAIHGARNFLRENIGHALGTSLNETYRRLDDSSPYSPDATSAGRRSLKNACLDLLVATRAQPAIELAVQQYGNANNMTDRMAELSALSLHDVPEREAALEDFYRRFEDDPLVVDKWFAIQATIPAAGTLERVRSLTRHPAFSFLNPNRVRSLVWWFAFGNATEFNRLDGQGYDFVADTVLKLDAKNPQLAARILGTFKSWRVLEPQRQARARATLNRILATEGLSADVLDIARRSLA